MQSVACFDDRFSTVTQGSTALQRLCSGAVWSEGPVWLPRTAELLFSDIPNNRILVWHAEQGLRVWRNNAEFTNGHTLEHDGSLLHCSHGLRAIVRTRLGTDGQAVGDTTLVSHYQGRRLNSPNDVVVKSDGSIWFTDPPYGIVSNREGHRAEREQRHHHVFRFCPRHGALRVVSDFLEEPNGLAFSPDERVLYVSDTSAALRAAGDARGPGHHHIVAFDVVGGQDLANPRIFANISPGLADGFRVDVQGFVYTSSADSVQVYHPDGTRLGRIDVPEKVGNLCFGGKAGNTLFICASTSLYSIVLNTQGAECTLRRQVAPSTYSSRSAGSGSD
jgi:gluconolactonase